MSEMEAHKGKTEKINFPSTVNSSAEKLLFLADYFDWKFEIDDIDSETDYVYFGNKVDIEILQVKERDGSYSWYRILENNEFDSDSCYAFGKMNSDKTISYDIQYYNGANGFFEVVEKAIKLAREAEK